MKGEDTGYSPWARERDERKRGRKLLDKGGVLEAPAVTSENNGAALCGQTTIPSSHFPSFSFIARRSSPILPPPHKHLSGSSVWRAEWGKHERRDESMHPSVCV